MSIKSPWIILFAVVFVLFFATDAVAGGQVITEGILPPESVHFDGWSLWDDIKTIYRMMTEWGNYITTGTEAYPCP